MPRRVDRVLVAPKGAQVKEGVVVTRPYEALFILKTTGTEAELAQSVKQVEEPVKKLGGQIDSSVGWGRRRLAYQIARHGEGHYHLLQFRVEPKHLEELKRLFRLNELIVRFLVLNRADALASTEALASGAAPGAVRLSSVSAERE